MPYIKTAFFNAGKLGDIQSHINPIRIKVNGDGNLRVFLFTTENVTGTELNDEAMSLSNARSLNYLSNFVAEKCCLKLMTSEIDEYFIVSNIYAYVKPSVMSFPQT